MQSLFIYILSFLISTFFAFMYQRSYANKESIYLFKKFRSIKEILWMIFIIAAPLFLATVRTDVGTDFYNYVLIYNVTKSLPFIEIMNSTLGEPLFLLINRISALIFGDWGMFFIAAFITMIFVFISSRYYKSNLNIALVFFIFYMSYYSTSLNIIRQMIAVTIVLYSYRFILERKPLKYFLFIFIASQFHTSAFICLLFYLVGFKRNDTSAIKKIIYYSAIVGSIFLLAPLMEMVINLSMFNKYLQYYTIAEDGGGIGFLMLIFPVILPILFYRKLIVNKGKRYDVLIDLLLLQIPLQYSGYYSNFANRLTIYSSIIQIILVPILIRAIKDKREKLIVVSYYLIWYVGYYIYYFYYLNDGETFPYKWILG